MNFGVKNLGPPGGSGDQQAPFPALWMAAVTGESKELEWKHRDKEFGVETFSDLAFTIRGESKYGVVCSVRYARDGEEEEVGEGAQQNQWGLLYCFLALEELKQRIIMLKEHEMRGWSTAEPILDTVWDAKTEAIALGIPPSDNSSVEYYIEQLKLLLNETLQEDSNSSTVDSINSSTFPLDRPPIIEYDVGSFGESRLSCPPNHAYSSQFGGQCIGCGTGSVGPNISPTTPKQHKTAQQPPNHAYSSHFGGQCISGGIVTVASRA
eukprot:gene17075-23370_t